MMRRILVSALVVALVHSTLPVSAFAEQPSPAKNEQAKSATSAQPRVYADLPTVKSTLDLRNAAQAITPAASTSRRQTLRQTSGGGFDLRQNKLLLTGVIVGAVVGLLVLENTAPKATDARCSSANPQF